jgi:signal transduction histidine kinase
VGILATVFILGVVNRRKLIRQKIKFQEQLALEKQRQRITADLHDDIGATLSSLQINSMVANTLITHKPAEAQTILYKIETQAHNLASTISDIVWSMKPGNEEFMTLSTRIKKFAGEILEPGQIHFTIDIPAEIDKKLTDITLRKNLLLILKEAINNAAKHSQAAQLRIGLLQNEKNIIMEVTDNGIGFNPQQVLGNGLGNMQYRAGELGGYVSVQSTQGKGTTVTAMIPLIP